METNQLALDFANQPKPQYLDFPFRSESAQEEIRKAAAKKYPASPRPSRVFDTPWGFQRRRTS